MRREEDTSPELKSYEQRLMRTVATYQRGGYLKKHNTCVWIRRPSLCESRLKSTKSVFRFGKRQKTHGWKRLHSTTSDWSTTLSVSSKPRWNIMSNRFLSAAR